MTDHTFSAVILMDRFVTKAHVEAFARHVPVFVLAWNGMLDIERYRDELGDCDVTYLGTDESAGLSGAHYRPMIDSTCSFLRWRRRLLDHRHFAVEGRAAYRARWMRTRLCAGKITSHAIAVAAAALHRRHALRDTIMSGFLTQRLIWAGNCQLLLSDLGFDPAELASFEKEVEAVRATTDATLGVARALVVLARWRDLAREHFRPEHAYRGFYATNTLLRWASLRFLLQTVPDSTWFFGTDNVGLELKFELDLYGFAPYHNVAFLDFGGKTSPAALYPRALQLLARDCYVIPILTDEDPLPTLQAVQRGLASGPDPFFTRIEARRHRIYGGVQEDETLLQVHRRVWGDFVAELV